MGKTMNQDRICYRAVFSVLSERAVEIWQEAWVNSYDGSDIYCNTGWTLFQMGRQL